MFLEVVRSEGLSHLSYVVGAGGHAAVIDPRRDIEVYLDIARRHEVRISHIFETHRNEDYVIGSTELARRTGAEILHGAAFDFDYGHAVKEGERIELGNLGLRVLETPGHTLESLSVVLTDSDFGEDAVAVFTGDALFIGDVGRTDFYPDRAREVAGLLYDSIFEKLLPLGDHVLLYPAHGAGSVCGAGMADREISTLGHERRNNPRLQLGRAEFIEYKLAEHHAQPPYFREMERLNKEGAPALVTLPEPRPADADVFAKAIEAGLVVLDVRSPEAVAGASLPGSVAIPLGMVPSFAGWLLSYDQDLGIVADRHEDVGTVVRYLVRLGYERVTLYLTDGLHAWQKSGRAYESIPVVHARDLKHRLETGAGFTLLDVRGRDEVEKVRLPDSQHIYVGELPERLAEIQGDRPITTFCGSGRRALVAASILKRSGFDDVEVCLGSMAACLAVGCEVIRGSG